MNSKKLILLSCVVPCVFAVSTATAQMRGHRAATARMPMHRAPMLNSASGFQRRPGGDFDRDDRFGRFNRFRDFDRDDRRFFRNRFVSNRFVFVDSFGFPFWGWGWGWPYGYYGGYGYGYPYGYGYDYDYYSQPAYGYGYGNQGYGYGNQGYGYGDQGHGYGDRYRGGSSVAQLQRRLARAGYYHGAIDGIMGPETRRAIRAYEGSRNQREYGMSDRY